MKSRVSVLELEIRNQSFGAEALFLEVFFEFVAKCHILLLVLSINARHTTQIGRLRGNRHDLDNANIGFPTRSAKQILHFSISAF